MGSKHTPVKVFSHAYLGGTSKIYRFANGYGASVICHPGSYGFEDGLWELAVALYHGEGEDDWRIDYSTPITNDVLGYLTEEQVEETLSAIEALPPASQEV